MVVISTIISLINDILALKKRRDDSDDAFDLLLTTLRINVPVLERIDRNINDDSDMLPARTELHETILKTQTIIQEYHNASIMADYLKKFTNLMQRFQISIAALTLLATFPSEERKQITQSSDADDSEHDNNDPPVMTAQIVQESTEALSEVAKARLMLMRYDGLQKRLQAQMPM